MDQHMDYLLDKWVAANRVKIVVRREEVLQPLHPLRPHNDEAVAAYHDDDDDEDGVLAVAVPLVAHRMHVDRADEHDGHDERDDHADEDANEHEHVHDGQQQHDEQQQQQQQQPQHIVDGDDGFEH